jgi:SAM-dependent methyltransferase
MSPAYALLVPRGLEREALALMREAAAMDGAAESDRTFVAGLALRQPTTDMPKCWDGRGRAGAYSVLLGGGCGGGGGGGSGVGGGAQPPAVTQQGGANRSALGGEHSHHQHPPSPQAPAPPSAALLACSCVDAALAIVTSREGLDAKGAPDAAALVRGAGIDSASVAAAVRTLARHRRLPAAPSFRVATLRGGRHAPSVTMLSVSAAVADALVAAQEEGCAAAEAAAVGGGSSSSSSSSSSSNNNSNSVLPPPWTVDLERPDVLVVVLLLQGSLLVGLLLPPFLPRRSAVLPRCPRAYLTDPAGRGFFSPSRAACLVRLLGLLPGEVLLDPCGGVGVLPIEAALAQPRLGRAISLDNDPLATRIACEHAAAATAGAGIDKGGSGGCAPLEVLLGDALSMPSFLAGSVDVALSDLPFGNRHAKLDVGALLAELWRVLRPGGRGRALLVVKAMDRAKLERAARSHSAKKPWRCEGATAFASGGIDVVAVLFVREGPPATPPRAAARAGGALTALGCRIARLEAGERAAAARLEAVRAAVEAAAAGRGGGARSLHY